MHEQDAVRNPKGGEKAKSTESEIEGDLLLNAGSMTTTSLCTSGKGPREKEREGGWSGVEVLVNHLGPMLFRG